MRRSSICASGSRRLAGNYEIVLAEKRLARPDAGDRRGPGCEVSRRCAASPRVSPTDGKRAAHAHLGQLEVS